MSDMQERIGRLRVQVIDQRVRPVLRTSPVGAIVVARRRADVRVPQKPHLTAERRLVLQLHVRRNRDRDHRLVVLDRPDRQRVRRYRHLEHLPGHHMHRDVSGHHLHPKLRVTFTDIAAREPARIVRLILDPEPHVPLRRLLDDELHLVHMSRRQVRRFARRLASRRKVKNEHPIRRHPVQISRNSLLECFRIRPVPSGKRRDRPILVRRRLEVRRNLGGGRHRHLLPRTLRLQPWR
jgi:hypothetical protein